MAERNFLDLNDRRNRIAFAQAWIKEARPSKPTEADVAKIYASSVRALSPKSEKSGEEKAKTTVLNAAKRYMKLTGSAEVKDLVGVVGEASRQIEADKKKEAKS